MGNLPYEDKAVFT